MTCIVVQLPPRDSSVPPTDWQLPSLPFVLFDASGRRLRSGAAPAGQLPSADEQVIMLAPSDVLLLSATVPPVAPQRMRQALPNLVEDQLLQDAARCHFALAEGTGADGRRTIAVVDRAWMRFVVEHFGAGEGRRMRVVPILSCLPEASDGQCHATLLEGPWNDRGRVEVAFSEGGLPFGMAIDADALADSLANVAGERELTRRRLVLAAPGTVEPTLSGVAEISFESVAQRALAATPDLCQFEFALQRWHGVRAALYRWRVPVGLVAAAIVVTIAAINIQWLMLSRERAHLGGRSEELLREAFPKTTTILDASAQMNGNLEALRATAGELAPGDFLSLAARLGDATGPLPADAIGALDYSNRALIVTFRSGAAPQSQVADTLRQAGLAVKIDGDKWQIQSEGRGSK